MNGEIHLTAAGHYRRAEELLARVRAMGDDDWAPAPHVMHNMLLAAQGHAMLAAAGAVALTGYDRLPDRDRADWMRAAGNHGPGRVARLTPVPDDDEDDDRCRSCGHLIGECPPPGCLCCPQPDAQTENLRLDVSDPERKERGR